jgi:hypothetical protein
MKNWKVLLGVGGACAVCCSVPLIAGVTALAAGASGALTIYPGAVLPAAGIALTVSLVGAAGVWGWRRATRKESACACGPAAAATGAPGGCNASSCS